MPESAERRPDDNLENAKEILSQNEKLKQEIQDLFKELSLEIEQISEPRLVDLSTFFRNLKSTPELELKKVQAISEQIIQKQNAFIDNYIHLQHFKSDNSANTKEAYIDLIAEIKVQTFPDIPNIELVEFFSKSPKYFPEDIQVRRREALALQASFFARQSIQQLVEQNENYFNPLRCGETDVVQLGARMYQLYNDNQEFLESINQFNFLNTPNDLYANLHFVLTSLLEEGETPILKFKNKIIDDPYSLFYKISVPVLHISTEKGFSKVFDFSDYFIPRLYSPDNHSFESADLFDAYDKSKAKREIKEQIRGFKQMNFTKELTKDFGQKIEPLSQMPSSLYSRLFKNQSMDEVKVLDRLKSHIMSLQMDESSRSNLTRTFQTDESTKLTDEQLLDLKTEIEQINLEGMSFVMDPYGNIIDLTQLSDEDLERNYDIKESLENIKGDLAKIIDKLIEIN